MILTLVGYTLMALGQAQQTMGLRLQATSGPVEVLVIARVERPSAN